MTCNNSNTHLSASRPITFKSDLNELRSDVMVATLWSSSHFNPGFGRFFGLGGELIAYSYSGGRSNTCEFQPTFRFPNVSGSRRGNEASCANEDSNDTCKLESSTSYFNNSERRHRLVFVYNVCGSPDY